MGVAPGKGISRGLRAQKTSGFWVLVGFVFFFLVAQAELLILLPTYQVVGLQVCTTTPGLFYVVLEMEPRTPHMLSEHSALYPVFQHPYPFFDIILPILPPGC